MKTTHDTPYGYLNITVNGTPLQYVQSFSVKHCPDTVPVHAFGEESAVAYVSQGSHFELNMECLPCLDAALFQRAAFDTQIQYENRTETYRRCRLSALHEHQNASRSGCIQQIEIHADVLEVEAHDA